MFHRFTSTCCYPPTAKIIVAVAVVVATVSSDKVDGFHRLQSFNPFYHGSLPPTPTEVENSLPTHAQVRDADAVDQEVMKLVSLLRRLAGGGDMWIQNGKR